MTARHSAGVEIRVTDGETFSSYGRWHTPRSVVCWASGTKVFVAALARALVSSGALDWDLPVGQLLGERTPEHVTVASLVEHRSGLPRVLPEQESAHADPYRSWTVERFDARVLPSLAELASAGPRGESGYSNLGYALLGRAMEIAFDASWLDLVRHHVIAPLGLETETVSVRRPEGIEAQGDGALSPRSLRGRAVPDWDLSTGPFSAAGGLCATVADMSAALQASLDLGGHLTRSDGPQAWGWQEGRAVHAGALLRSGSLLMINPENGTVGAVHAVGGLPGRGAQLAERRLTAFVRTVVPPRSP